MMVALIALISGAFAQYEKWEKITPANSPDARSETSMVFDIQRNTIVLYGGMGTSSRYFDTWEFSDGNWGVVSTGANHPSGSGPGGFVYDSDRGVSVWFGGISGNNFFNETWEYSGKIWTEVFPQDSPSKRFATAMAYDSARKKVVLFGGYGTNPANPTTNINFNDTWEYDGSNWTKITTAATPDARSYHSMVYDTVKGKVLLYGGKNVNNKVWQYDGTNWEELVVSNPSNGIPSQRYSMSMAYNDFHKKVIMYGGFNFGAYFNETWELYGNTWKKITTSSIPGYPYAGAMIWSADDKRCYYFGGKDTSYSTKDLWYYTEDPYPSGTIIFEKNIYSGYANPAKIIVADYNLANQQDAKDTITVHISSDDDKVGFDITLKETTNNSGIFTTTSNGTELSMTFMDSDGVNKVIKVLNNHYIKAEYYYAYRQNNISATAQWVEDTHSGFLTFNQDVYQGLDKKVNITVFDANRPNDPLKLDEVSVLVTSDVDPVGFNMKLREIGPKAGIYSSESNANFLNFSITKSDESKSRILIDEKSVFTAKYIYAYNNNEVVQDSATWIGYPANIYFDKTEYININSTATLTLFEPEKNLDPTYAESAVCHVYSDVDQSGFYVTLWEDGPDTSRFSTIPKNTPIGFSGGFSNPIKYKIKVSSGVNITATFVDDYPDTTVKATALWRQENSSWLFFDKKTFINEKTIRVSLLADELNLNGEDNKPKFETPEIMISTTSQPEGIRILLTEDNINCGIYRGYIQLREENETPSDTTLLVKDGDDVIAQTPPDNYSYPTPLKVLGTYLTYAPHENEPKGYILDGPEDESVIEYNSNIFFRLASIRLDPTSSEQDPSTISADSFDYQVKLAGVDTTWISLSKNPNINGERVDYAYVPDGEYTFYFRSQELETPNKSYHKERTFYVRGQNKAIFRPPIASAVYYPNKTVGLSWDYNAYADYYQIYRRNIAYGPFELVNKDQPTTGTQYVDTTIPQFDAVYEYYVAAKEVSSGMIRLSNFMRIYAISGDRKSGTLQIDKSLIDFGTYKTQEQIILQDISSDPEYPIGWCLTTDCPYLKFDKNYGQVQQVLSEVIYLNLDRKIIPPGTYNYTIYISTSASSIIPDVLNNSKIIPLKFKIPGPIIYAASGFYGSTCAPHRFPYISDEKNTDFTERLFNGSHINWRGTYPAWGEGNGVLDIDEFVNYHTGFKNTGTVSADSISAILYEEDQYITLPQDYYLKYNQIDAQQSSPQLGFVFATSPDIPELRTGYQTYLYMLTVDNDMYQWVSYTPFVIYNVKPIEITHVEIDDDKVGGSDGNSNELIDPGERIEARVTMKNPSLFPFNDISLRMNAQMTNCVENFYSPYSYVNCSWDDYVTNNQYRFRDIFFSSNYPSLYMTIDFGKRSQTYTEPGYFEAQETYVFGDIEFRTFSYWVGSPYNYFEVPRAGDTGGYIEKNPHGLDNTRNYQGDEMIFQLQVDAFNVFNNGWYRTYKTIIENPFTEVIYEDDFTSNTLWSNAWRNSNENPLFQQWFDPLEMKYDETGGSPGFLSITSSYVDESISKGKFGFFVSPDTTHITDMYTTYTPSANGYYIPSDPTGYILDTQDEENLVLLSPTYLYRAGFLVGYDSTDPGATRENSPSFRFRAMTYDQEQVNSLLIQSQGAGNSSPDYMGEQEYTMIFDLHNCDQQNINSPANKLLLAFDMINFPAYFDLQDATLYLKKVRVERVSQYKLQDWDTLYNYDFSNGNQGWTPYSVSGGATCWYDKTNKALKISTSDNTNTFAFWNSPPSTGDITLKPNRMYKLTYNTLSSEANSYESPMLRCRVATTNNQVTALKDINNKSTIQTGFGTSNVMITPYQLYFQPPKVITTSTDNKAYTAFDLLSIDPFDAINSSIAINDVKIQESKHIRWKTFDRIPNINLIRNPGFEDLDLDTGDKFWEIENNSIGEEELSEISVRGQTANLNDYAKLARRALRHRYNDTAYNQSALPFDLLDGTSHGGKKLFLFVIRASGSSKATKDLIIDVKLKQRVSLKNIKGKLAQWAEAGVSSINDVFESGFYFCANNRNYGTGSSYSDGDDGRINNNPVVDGALQTPANNLVIYHELSPLYQIPDGDMPLGEGTQLPYVDTARYHKEVWQYKRIGEYKVSGNDLSYKAYTPFEFSADNLASLDYVDFTIHIYAKYKPTPEQGSMDPYIICIDDCELRLKEPPALPDAKK